jgi:hypothetical protein
MYLTAAAGHVVLQAGDHNGARETLTGLFNQPRAIPRRQRVLVLTDLATAELHSGNLPDAYSYATQAADPLHHAAYAVAAARLRAFHPVSERVPARGAVRALDAHFSEIAA